MRSHRCHRIGPILLAAACLATLGSSRARAENAPTAAGVGVRAADETAAQALDRIKREAGGVPQQALALARTAWLDGPRDPELAALARQELVDFGDKGLDALGWAVRHVPERFQADVVAVALESNAQNRGAMPTEYAPTIETALWFGSREAKRLAMYELATLNYTSGVLTIVDAAFEHPALTLDAVRALGRMGNDRVRAFLVDVLHRGTAQERFAAAEALARIGNRCLVALREATRSPDRDARTAAMAVLLPISTLDDVSLLHEFVAQHAADDPDLTTRVRGRAEQLELLLELEQEHGDTAPARTN